MCNIRFEMSGIDTYKLCAKVTVFDLECERRGDGRRLLQFYWGTAMKQKVGNVYYGKFISAPCIASVMKS